MRPVPYRLRRARAFTLVEIMIVVAIAALVLTMSVPAVFRTLNKEGMRKATSDLLEACQTARAAAIISGKPAELVLRPLDKSFSVTGAAVSEENEELGSKIEAPRFSAQFPDEMDIVILGVNFVEMQEEEEARVKFYPNGTSDEFTIVISSLTSGEMRKFSVEVITGVADYEVIK